jgi:hypothetical protein
VSVSVADAVPVGQEMTVALVARVLKKGGFRAASMLKGEPQFATLFLRQREVGGEGTLDPVPTFYTLAVCTDTPGTTLPFTVTVWSDAPLDMVDKPPADAGGAGSGSAGEGLDGVLRLLDPATVPAK